MADTLFSAARLMDKAQTQTGLSDFGDDRFRPGLERLVTAINTEGRLSGIGQAAAAQSLLEILVNRLEIEFWYTRHPEIDEVQILPPLFVLGLPRTGSTALGQMLATDPETRALMGWQAMRPCPPVDDDGAKTDPRLAEYNRRTRAYVDLVPSVADAMPMGDDSPMECFALLEMGFGSICWDAFMNVPSFTDWLRSGEGWAQVGYGYEYHRRVIQLLQWRKSPKRWMLRAPAHSFGIEHLDRLYPGAHYVMTHRPVEKVMPSLAQVMHDSRKVFLTDPDPQTFAVHLVDLWDDALRRLLAFRARTGDERFLDVFHRDQIADPIPGIHRIYDWCGWSFDDATVTRIRNWQKRFPKGDYRPQADLFGFDSAALRDRFRYYVQRFPGRI